MSDDITGFVKLVSYRLDDMAAGLQRVEDKVETLLIDVAMLKVKSGIWGAVAGMIPASIAVVLSVMLG